MNKVVHMCPDVSYQKFAITCRKNILGERIYTWFNNRLKIELHHEKDHEVIVSRERVTDFKQWLDQ